MSKPSRDLRRERRRQVWSIGIGRYSDRAETCRVLASWVDAEYRALEGGHERQVALDNCDIFHGTLAP